MPNLKPKKSLQKYEIGGKGKQDVKKLIKKVEIGGHVAVEYKSRVKALVD